MNFILATMQTKFNGNCNLHRRRGLMFVEDYARWRWHSGSYTRAPTLWSTWL